MSQHFQQVISQFQIKVAWPSTPDYLQRQKYCLKLEPENIYLSFKRFYMFLFGTWRLWIGPLEEMITVIGTR